MAKTVETVVGVLNGQHVRLRLQGAGPPAILCHESPRSSAALLPLASKISDRFTCIMLDTPGFGLSDPMPMARPEIPDFARIIPAVMDALGIERAPVYGTHTGAAIAMAAAVAAPERVTAAILDGYAIFTDDERAELLASYLPPFLPSLDGTHVAWLWARIRDQFTAFPWNRVADGPRLKFGPPPLDFVQSVVTDFLQAGDNYRIGYAAAFRYDHFAPLKQCRVPVRLGTREDDLLFPHMERARGLGDNVTLQPLSADRTRWAASIGDLIGEHVTGEMQDAATLLARAAGHQGQVRMAMTSAGPVHLRLDGNEAAPTVVLLADLPGGLRDLDFLAARLSRQYRVIRIDVPGQGASHPPGGPIPPLPILAGAAGEALAELGAERAARIAFGASLPLAVELPPAPIIAVDPWPAVALGWEDQLPDLSPRWDGAHLTQAFWWARDYDIFKPWCHRVNAEGRGIGAERDAVRIDQRFRASVLAAETGVALARRLYTAMRGGFVERLAGIVLYETDPDLATLGDWAESRADGQRIVTVPREDVALAEAVGKQLASLG